MRRAFLTDDVREPIGSEPLTWPFRTEWRVIEAPLTIAPRSTIWRDRDLFIAADASEKGLFQIGFADSLRFEVDFPAKEIRIRNLDEASAETVRHLVLDQIYPRILAHEGHLVLHSASVMIDDGAVLLVGSSGSGKSTLAASFHAQGYRLIGDDAVIGECEGGLVKARAIYPSLRLFEDSLKQILPSAHGLSRVADYTSKWNVNEVVAAHQPEAVSVSALFILDPVPLNEAAVNSVGRADACMALVEQSFALDPTDSDAARQRMIAVSDILQNLPTFRLSYPRDYRRLAEVRQVIVDAVAND